MQYAVLFPGQGSQFVGMGEDVFDARPDLLGTRADEVLGWSLRDLCRNGPEEALTATDRAQPALFAVAYALWEGLAEAVDHAPVAAAGHSLGEYTALAAAGALDFATGLNLVAARGRAMDRAASVASSGMAALMGADAESAHALAAARREDGGRLYVANRNAPGQVVVAGGSDDIEWLVENARDLGVRRAIPLKVAGAFHSPFMASAAEELGAALDAVTFHPPAFPVYANVSAAPTRDPAAALAQQLVGTVRFDESLQAMSAAGVDTFVHVGPGSVTAGMAKRSAPDAETLTVSSLEDVPTVARALAVQ
jgi:[acyl-carrier-protein] S-malonyltransferase